jgi:hypothetical protein
MSYCVAVIAGDCQQGEVLGSYRKLTKAVSAIYGLAARAKLDSWHVGVFQEGRFLGQIDRVSGKFGLIRPVVEEPAETETAVTTGKLVPMEVGAG